MPSTRLRQRKAVPSIALRRGLTFVELLLVLAIYALLMSILLPAVSALRNRGMTAKCLANLHEIATCTALYTHAQQGRKQIPWYQYPAHEGYSPNLFTPWVFGGFKAPNPDLSGGYTVDAAIYPAEIRPLNKYVDRQARGSAIIDLYVCPADSTHSNVIIGGGGAPWGILDSRSSWEVNGSSYTLNVRFMQGYALPNGAYSLYNVPEYTERIAKHMIAGEASKFIMWVEQGFYSATYAAGPTTAGIGTGPLPLRYGWHGGFSEYPVGFADGHAQYGFYDTRTIFGLGGTIWQPNFRHGL